MSSTNVAGAINHLLGRPCPIPPTARRGTFLRLPGPFTTGAGPLPLERTSARDLRATPRPEPAFPLPYTSLSRPLHTHPTAMQSSRLRPFLPSLSAQASLRPKSCPLLWHSRCHRRPLRARCRICRPVRLCPCQWVEPPGHRVTSGTATGTMAGAGVVVVEASTTAEYRFVADPRFSYCYRSYIPPHVRRSYIHHLINVDWIAAVAP